MALSPFESFKVVLLVMLFYGFSMTLITHAMPADALPYADFATSSINAEYTDYDSVTSSVQGNLESQKDIPLLDVGALVFYSGNILIDLIINFATAIPQMFILIINGFMLLFGSGLDPYIMGIVQGFATSIILIFYILGISQLILGVRSGRVV